MKIAFMRKWTLALAVLALAGCSTINASQVPTFAKGQSWVLLPMANFTETPDAGARASSIAQSIMIQQGFADLRSYEAEADAADLESDVERRQARAQSLDWARKSGARYALGGSVQEWRYKVGVDGEPVAGVTFDVVDLNSGKVVWSATGSRSGWSRSSLAGVGQTLIQQLLAPLAQK
ncbi:penicillin-binding protein activator LpoB [Xenophilus sp. AP218F]|nr:penicillin-binding protein activator LpoB [Chromobacterium sp. ASV5]OWY37282.1 penicillin-binding protein activator LpoB [Xenophilus sp. AP218F]